MMTRVRILTPLVAALFAGVACSDDDDNGSGPATEFVAVLSGDNEVPPVATDAAGTATLTVEDDAISYTIDNVTDLLNPVVAHIHVEAEGANGPVRLNLCGTGAPEPECAVGEDVLATGSNGVTLGITFDSLVSAMRSGGAYVNVHTSDLVPPDNSGPGDFPGGEIRGQIEPQ
jgi:CHRD domain